MPIIVEGQLRANPQLRSKEADPGQWDEVRDADRVAAKHGYTLVRQLQSKDSYQMILTKHIPKQRIEKYLRAAMKKASARQLEDGMWYADIPGFDGVWANEEGLQDCLNVLDEVLLDWLLLKIEDEDRDIPVLEGIDFNVL